MIVINEKNNRCRTAVEYQRRSYATKQLEFDFKGSSSSHNIYFSKSPKLSDSLHKSEQFDKTARTSKFDCSENDNLLTNSLQDNPMILINGKKGLAKKAAGDKQRFYRTNQLKSKQIDNITSHNIYFTKLAKLSKSLQKSDKPERTVRFNILGCADILTIPVKKLKSYYKDEIGTFIEIAGMSQPIQVRDSIFEIDTMINKER